MESKHTIHIIGAAPWIMAQSRALRIVISIVIRLHQAATSAHRPGRPATGRNSRQVKTYYIDIIQLRYPFADSVCCVCNVCLCFALFINRDAPNSSKDIYIYIYMTRGRLLSLTDRVSGSVRACVRMRVCLCVCACACA